MPLCLLTILQQKPYLVADVRAVVRWVLLVLLQEVAMVIAVE